jgi:hypothetical protein
VVQHGVERIVGDARGEETSHVPDVRPRHVPPATRQRRVHLPTTDHDVANEIDSAVERAAARLDFEVAGRRPLITP